MRAYEPRPLYPPANGQVVHGWGPAVESLPAHVRVLAVDGPEMQDWPALATHLEAALRASGRTVSMLDAHAWLRSWVEIESRTASPELRDDPDFAMLSDASMSDLLDVPELARPSAGTLLVYGPGAGLVRSDVLWFADLPKRFAEAAMKDGRGRNLGAPGALGPGTTQRLFFIDWPIQDRHRAAIAPHLDRWLDVQDATDPTSLDGPSWRATIRALSERPFRVQPTFLSISWGGHWAQRVLGMNVDEPNSGIGYELIAPENGVLIGTAGARPLEVPFQLFTSLEPERVLGPAVQAEFGTSFPIRFDYLDTIEGDSLSVHCHPRTDYMRRTFGWPYTQHETYYVMRNSEDSVIFLGLRDGVDLDEFERKAHEATDHERGFDILEYVQSHPATLHQLFAVPGGTPHGSGKGNVVLEVSATPYLYSLRFYDWLRRDEQGALRPVHVDHAFANLQHDHVGPAVVSDLIREPVMLRSGPGWREEELSAVPEVFFDVRRFVLDPGAALPDHTDGRFHILNVVEGMGVIVETDAGHTHDVAYAETIVIPASVGSYRVRSAPDAGALLVKALVR